MRILKALVSLIKDFIKTDRQNNELTGLYIINETPKTYGTKIRRFSNDSE